MTESQSRKNELLNALADRIRSDETLASSEKEDWIDCSDRLPERRDRHYRVLGWFPGMDQPDTWCDIEVRGWVSADDPIPGAKWKHLPEAPK